jgi:hypothetical protein
VISFTSRRMSEASRWNVVVRTSGRIRCRVIDFGRANARSPSAPWIRPYPDSSDPPNGSDGTPTNATTAFTEVIPERSARAAAMPRRRFEVNTDEPSA